MTINKYVIVRQKWKKPRNKFKLLNKDTRKRVKNCEFVKNSFKRFGKTIVN
jgi:hypothetical protein